MSTFFNTDTNGRKLVHGIEPPRPQYHKYSCSVSFPTEEDMACEAQLSALGTWEPLKFQISGWHKDEKNVTELWRPFQPKKNISNDLDSGRILEGDRKVTSHSLSATRNGTCNILVSSLSILVNRTV